MLRRVLFLLTGVLCPFALDLAAALPRLTAKYTNIDTQTREVVLTEDARLEYEGVVLTADEIRFNQETQQAVARGRVVLQQEARRLLAEEVTYRIGDRAFSVRGLRFGADPVYISGDVLSGTPADVVVENAVATFREPSPWAPTLSAKRLRLRDSDQLEVDGGRLGVGRAQFLPIPAFPIPVDKIFLEYFSFGAGYRGGLGAFVELGVHLPLLPGARLGGEVGYYSDRGVMFGPSGTYEVETANGYARGSFQTGYIHDSGDKLRDVLGERIPEGRGFVGWDHRQQIGDRLTLAAQLNYWTDSEILRDFRPEAFYPIQQPDNFLEATYVTDNLVLSAFTRANLNRYFRVQERLPEVRLDLLPTPVLRPELGLYHRLNASVARLVEDEPLRGPTVKSDRADVYYALTRPLKLSEWLNVRPVAGVRATHYARPLSSSGKDDYTRTLGELGVDADLRASAIYDYQNPRWKINGLRHLVTPKVSYRYIPEAEKGRRYIPALDRRSFSTYLQPLGLGDQRNTDDLHKTNTLRLGVDNLLQTREAEYGSRDLVMLNFAVDNRFADRPGERTLSDLHTELALMPAPWLRFDVYQRTDLYGGDLQELNTGFSIQNSQWWSVRLGTHYLDGDISEYVADGRFRLNEVYEAFTRLHYDSRRSRFVQQTYGLRQTFDNLWILQYGISFYEGRRREGSFGFVVELEAVRF